MLNQTQATTANRRAKLFPADDMGALPCIEVAGVQVYAYFNEIGTLCVSVHYDTADDAATTHKHTVPTMISAGEKIVWKSEEI